MSDDRFKCEPDTNSYVMYEQQCGPNVYGAALAPPAPPFPPTVHSTSPGFLMSHDLSTDTSAYSEVKTDDSFSHKYPNSSSDFLGESSLEDQLLPPLSTSHYEYNLPPTANNNCLQSTVYPMNPVLKEGFPDPESQSFQPFMQDCHPTIYSYTSLAQPTLDQSNGNPAGYYNFEETGFIKPEYAEVDVSEVGKGSNDNLVVLDDSPRTRNITNTQLNPNAVAIMDDWYRAHLERPYPNKEEKLRMALAGNITETQVGSWFANRRNRSNNTRPKQNMKRLKSAIGMMCYEYQSLCNGLVNAAEMQTRIFGLIEHHTKF